MYHFINNYDNKKHIVSCNTTFNFCLYTCFATDKGFRVTYKSGHRNSFFFCHMPRLHKKLYEIFFASNNLVDPLVIILNV